MDKLTCEDANLHDCIVTSSHPCADDIIVHLPVDGAVVKPRGSIILAATIRDERRDLWTRAESELSALFQAIVDLHAPTYVAGVPVDGRSDRIGPVLRRLRVPCVGLDPLAGSACPRVLFVVAVPSVPAGSLVRISRVTFARREIPGLSLPVTVMVGPSGVESTALHLSDDPYARRGYVTWETHPLLLASLNEFMKEPRTPVYLPEDVEVFKFRYRHPGAYGNDRTAALIHPGTVARSTYDGPVPYPRSAGWQHIGVCAVNYSSNTVRCDVRIRYDSMVGRARLANCAILDPESGEDVGEKG